MNEAYNFENTVTVVRVMSPVDRHLDNQDMPNVVCGTLVDLLANNPALALAMNGKVVGRGLPYPVTFRDPVDRLPFDLHREQHFVGKD